ncbi:hypothetical protein PWY87_27745 [Kribbella solani]|uniref:hypothetical protein n=1 Tax=Kribbella solani TaxID=236067 RepID=UPI0029AD07C6|nr:hypothetical protein [Kribbella solani]MDX2971735.1 hypothetical protein [Kribbella solani]MDX3005503.1 hypothetical protein [Kribbella solani]
MSEDDLTKAVLKAIHDGRPDPSEAFDVKDGDNVVHVQPVGELSRPSKPRSAPKGKSGGRAR